MTNTETPDDRHEQEPEKEQQIVDKPSQAEGDEDDSAVS
jgi:hypothetical protein